MRTPVGVFTVIVSQKASSPLYFDTGTMKMCRNLQNHTRRFCGTIMKTRLRKFDEASQRQHDRELSRFEKQDSESVTDQGWTREDLYDVRIQKILETP
jgi:hypothetical protein